MNLLWKSKQESFTRFFPKIVGMLKGKAPCQALAYR